MYNNIIISQTFVERSSYHQVLLSVDLERVGDLEQGWASSGAEPVNVTSIDDNCWSKRDNE